VDAGELEGCRHKLWWLCYRMTGVAADADELVQDTFLRALEAPPQDSSRELLPWLFRVAANASTDLLRKRAVRGYQGDWLPSPIELESLVDEGLSPSARYGQRESLSYAFLIALEALSPAQRAVLLLRDVFDYSVRETAEALSLSEANVKTQHHRARASLEQYERDRRVPDPAREGLARAAMLRLLALSALGDVATLARFLAEDVMAVNDANGEFHAIGRPAYTPLRVARFFVRFSPKTRVLRAHAGMFNGLAGVATELSPFIPGGGRITVNLFDVDPSGAITRYYGVLATRKLAHLPFAHVGSSVEARAETRARR
jgi:RNA polymerase sigma-70 factor (ECF subfamily)